MSGTKPLHQDLCEGCKKPATYGVTGIRNQTVYSESWCDQCYWNQRLGKTGSPAVTEAEPEPVKPTPARKRETSELRPIFGD